MRIISNIFTPTDQLPVQRVWTEHETAAPKVPALAQPGLSKPCEPSPEIEVQLPAAATRTILTRYRYAAMPAA